jgi:hypothetical protein
MTSTDFFNSFIGRQSYCDLTRDEAIEKSKEPDYVVSLKYDGIWGALVSDSKSHISDLGSSRASIYSRTKQVKATNFLHNFPLPDQTILIGEYMYGQEWASTPERKGKFYAFDCVYSNESIVHLPYSERYARMISVINQCGSTDLVAVKMAPANITESVLFELYQNKAFEGIVLRRLSDPYAVPLFRHKLLLTSDFVITGYSRAEEGQFAGLLGAFCISEYIDGQLVQVAHVGGGFTPKERADFWELRDSLIGKVIEVSYNKRFAGGSIRHPNFVRFRDDKLPEDCIFTP